MVEEVGGREIDRQIDRYINRYDGRRQFNKRNKERWKVCVGEKGGVVE